MVAVKIAQKYESNSKNIQNRKIWAKFKKFFELLRYKQNFLGKLYNLYVKNKISGLNDLWTLLTNKKDIINILYFSNYSS